MIGRLHRVRGEGEVGKVAGIRVVALVEQEAVLIFLVELVIGMGEDLIALRVQTGNGVAVHDEAVHAAAEIAVERHALGVCRILFGSLRAVGLCHAHGKQRIRRGLGVLRADERRRGIDPQVAVLRLGQLREQLLIGPADGRQIVAGLLRRSGLRGLRIRLALRAARNGQQAEHT